VPFRQTFGGATELVELFKKVLTHCRLVLSADLLRIPPEQLGDLEVWATITGGVVRHLAPVPVLS
jgi:hypothetical protein